VDRLLTRPGRLVTVLSNSRDNGGEFVQKCRDVCDKLGEVLRSQGASTEFEDLSPDLTYENMRMEVRITVGRENRPHQSPRRQSRARRAVSRAI
jgi:hypothetical protein